MTTVKNILQQKGGEVETISPDDNVFNAISRMADRNIGSLVVVENGEVIGLVDERHYARNVFLVGKSSPDTSVREIMDVKVPYANLHQTDRECMHTMTHDRVRHLPVLHGGTLVGILSIGDLVKSIISEQELTITQLENYIHAG